MPRHSRAQKSPNLIVWDKGIFLLASKEAAIAVFVKDKLEFKFSSSPSIINPLSSNIDIQILHTELLTFPSGVVEKIW